MPLTTVEAMNKFVDFLEPTLSDQYQIGEREKIVKRNLDSVFPKTGLFDYTGAILMGSAAKDTLIHPVGDIDILATFTADSAFMKYQKDSSAFLYNVRDLYNNVTTAKVASKRQAVTVMLQNYGYVDIAPVFLIPGEPDVYALPDGNKGWMSTAPVRAKNWFTLRDRLLNGTLSTFVKLLKAWNAAHGSCFGSYYLETMAATAFASPITDYKQALADFFQRVYTDNSVFNVVDPGGQSGQLNAWMSPEQVAISKLVFKNEANRARQALFTELRGDHASSKAQWSSILGINFPTN